MEFPIIPDDDALGKCTWCQKPISDEMSLFYFGVSLKPAVDVSEYASHCIEIDLVSEERQLQMMVCSKDSDAGLAGSDGLFLLCSKKCTNSVIKKIKTEIASGSFFDAIQDT